MFLAKVEGQVVATKKDPNMSGRKLLLLRPQLVDEKDLPMHLVFGNVAQQHLFRHRPH